MAKAIAFYLLLHQPLRFRLPLPAASPGQAGVSASGLKEQLFDATLNARYFAGVAQRSYRPTLTLLKQLLHEGLALNLGLSWTFWEQAHAYSPELVSLLRDVIGHPRVELIGVEPYHSFLPLIDPAMFRRRMRWMKKAWHQEFGKEVRITDTTEMLYSDGIYWALALEGFNAMLVDGRPNIIGSAEPTGIYAGPGSLAVIPRHWRLSDDVGYRFSNREWDGYPLYASTYAEWLAHTPGDVVTVGWDFETFGEHHREDTGIFPFLAHLPAELARRGCRTVRLGDVLDKPQTPGLKPPVRPATWAGTGEIEFFLGNHRQWALYERMQAAYHKAMMTRRSSVVDVSLRLMQSDHLHMLHWYAAQGPEADVSMYFTPGEWWQLGREAILLGLDAIFDRFISSLDPLLDHLPGEKGGPRVGT